MSQWWVLSLNQSQRFVSPAGGWWPLFLLQEGHRRMWVDCSISLILLPVTRDDRNYTFNVWFVKQGGVNGPSFRIRSYRYCLLKEIVYIKSKQKMFCFQPLLSSVIQGLFLILANIAAKDMFKIVILQRNREVKFIS